MNNLVPELRADKDGKLVTRHVRAATNEAAVKAFPAPMGQAKPSESADFKEVKNMLIGVLNHYRDLANGGSAESDPEDEDEGDGIDLDDEDDYWKMDDEAEPEDLGFDPNGLLEAASIGKALAELPENTIAHMRAKIEENPYMDDYEVAVLHALSYENNNPQLIAYLTCMYSEIAGFYSERDSLGDPDVNTYTLMRDYMQGLHNYESVGYELPKDIFSATPEERKVMEALHYLNTELGDDEGNAEPELGKIVMERPDSVEDVISIVLERDTRDAEVIREMLDSRTPSVRSGIL
jgi:hypothetical protein